MKVAPSRARRVLVGAAFSLASACPAYARGPSATSRACAESAAQAQSLRREGKLAEARVELDTCAADACPAFVRDDCRTWIAEIQAAQPTIVFGVRDGSVDLDVARVRVDGTVFVDRLDGIARPLDPGPHEVEVEVADGRRLRTRLVVREGEKQRVVVFALPARGAPAPPSPAERPGVTPWVWVSGALAAAGLAGFAVFGIDALSGLADLKHGCGATRSCTDEQIDANRRLFWIADASLAVGLVAGAVTGYLLIDHAHAVSVSARRGANGAFFELRTRF